MPRPATLLTTMFRARLGRLVNPLFITLPLSFAAVCLGCGRSGPPVEMVKGVIVLDGQPVEGAIVGFSPTGTAAALPASGRTKSDGSFRLTTVRCGAPDGGAQIGDYVVTVSKLERLPSDDPLPKFRPLVPPAYGELDSSPLRATVRRGVNAGPAFRYELRADFQAGAEQKPAE